MEVPGCDENIYLNKAISYDEIERVVKNLKLRKAVGIDKIPNEILKYKNIMIFMYRIFSYCFNHCVHKSGLVRLSHQF